MPREQYKNFSCCRSSDISSLNSRLLTLGPHYQCRQHDFAEAEFHFAIQPLRSNVLYISSVMKNSKVIYKRYESTIWLYEFNNIVSGCPCDFSVSKILAILFTAHCTRYFLKLELTKCKLRIILCDFMSMYLSDQKRRTVHNWLVGMYVIAQLLPAPIFQPAKSIN